jgi:hypothetical protein
VHGLYLSDSLLKINGNACHGRLLSRIGTIIVPLGHPKVKQNAILKAELN